MKRSRAWPWLGLLVLFLFVIPGGLRGDDIDWAKARQIHQKEQGGQPLTPDEQAYLDRAKAEHAAGGGPAAPGYQPAPGGGNGAQAAGLVPPGGFVPKDHTDLVPLTDLTGDYQGEDGGLYGKGRNTPPPEVLAAAQAQTAKIVPLGPDGKPAPDGKIVLLSIGMSNTTMEFTPFVQLANQDPAKSPVVVPVDGAQGGQGANRIADPAAPFWNIIDQRLQATGVTPAQVQVVWLKEAIPRPTEGFPAAMVILKNDLITGIEIAKSRYPNLRIAYLSSRTYGGYATVPINPEPYAYETAFADRWVIEAQMRGDPRLNFDPAKGEVKAPLLLWGPYLWADGVKGRKTDSLVWNRDDFGPDGTHPAHPMKVAQLLLTFFKTDPCARLWFVSPGR